MAVEIASHHHHNDNRQPLQPPHRLPSSTCDLHPDEPVTGFCAACLRERLAGLEVPAASSDRKSTSALRSVFSRASAAAGAGSGPSFLPPELRRSRSFSFSFGRGADGIPSQRPPASAAFEPQRRSCDVRGRSTLWSLFHKDDRLREGQNPSVPSSSSSSAAVVAVSTGPGIELGCRNQGLPGSSAAPTVAVNREKEDSSDEIKPVDPVVPELVTSGDIEEEGKGAVEEEETEPKLMKDHIDLDCQQQQQEEDAVKKPPPKDLKEIASNFWVAASVLSKKLQKWRRRQKLKKQGGEAAMRKEKLPKTSRFFCDTQSEAAMDFSGRISCDTDPRFSLDAGRMSFDGPRFSWDEPRDSWDGYLVGGRSSLTRLPPVLSVVEGAPVPAVQRSDYLIPVEEDATTPGGSAQTRDYYLDSSSGRRRSLDRSSSIREHPHQISESKMFSNIRVTPAAGNDFFPHGTLLDRDVKAWSSNSLGEDYLGSIESAFRDSHSGDSAKKSSRWSKAWNFLGFLQRRSSSRVEANIVDKSLPESWPELRSSASKSRMLRSNSSVSSRSSFSGNAGYRGMRTSSTRTTGNSKKRRDEFVPERNRSARYSPNHFDNGLLRFYLTPRQNGRRNGIPASGRQNPSHYFTRSMLGLY